jgi:pimeloyl-ACP methyl ester carboxylesterase
MAIPSQEMGVSAMHEIFKWSAVSRDTLLTAYASILRNINADFPGEKKTLHSSVTVIPDVGHFLPQVKPAEFNQTLEDIVQELN